jgi:hypothetical protein
MNTSLYFQLLNTLTRQSFSSMQMMMAAAETISYRSALYHRASTGQIPYPQAEMLGMFWEKAENFWLTGITAMFELQKTAAKNIFGAVPAIPSVLSTLGSLERIAAPTRKKVLANSRRLKRKKRN